MCCHLSIHTTRKRFNAFAGINTTLISLLQLHLIIGFASGMLKINEPFRLRKTSLVRLITNMLFQQYNQIMIILIMIITITHIFSFILMLLLSSGFIIYNHNHYKYNQIVAVSCQNFKKQGSYDEFTKIRKTSQFWPFLAKNLACDLHLPYYKRM